jgi:putative oxidoreductase
MNFPFTPEAAALFLARVFLGILFVIQGYDKLFSIGIKTVYTTIRPSFKKIHLPDFVILFAAGFSSIIEFAGGLMLILGLFKYAALYMLGIDLLMVAAAFSLIDPVWKLDIVFPRFLLLLFLLIVPGQLDTITLDSMFF